MRIVINDHTDPWFNLASEEYLIDRVPCENGGLMMLWRNEPSVIIGKNQNAYAEINEMFVRENGIKVVRRLTGGGAVFHDLGNVNYTCIVPASGCEALDFRRFAMPIIGALRQLGVPAEFSGRNDITADGKKISGNAQCVRNGKMMHHGTLLFRADMSKLSGALCVDPEKIKSKGIKSVRARVGNISDWVTGEMDSLAFKRYLENYFEGEKCPFSPDEEAEIGKLAAEKYSSWAWNFGESKEFSHTKKNYFPYGLVEVNVTSVGGVIREVGIYGDYFGLKNIKELEKQLSGVKYDLTDITKALSGVSAYIMGARAEEIAGLFMD